MSNVWQTRHVMYDKRVSSNYQLALCFKNTGLRYLCQPRNYIVSNNIQCTNITVFDQNQNSDASRVLIIGNERHGRNMYIYIYIYWLNIYINLQEDSYINHNISVWDIRSKIATGNIGVLTDAYVWGGKFWYQFADTNTQKIYIAVKHKWQVSD